MSRDITQLHTIISLRERWQLLIGCSVLSSRGNCVCATWYSLPSSVTHHIHPHQSRLFQSSKRLSFVKTNAIAVQAPLGRHVRTRSIDTRTCAISHFFSIGDHNLFGSPVILSSHHYLEQCKFILLLRWLLEFLFFQLPPVLDFERFSTCKHMQHMLHNELLHVFSWSNFIRLGLMNRKVRPRLRRFGHFGNVIPELTDCLRTRHVGGVSNERGAVINQ